MIQLTQNNYEDILNDKFKQHKTIICMVGTPSCENCVLTRENIALLTEDIISRIEICYIDYTSEDILQSSYEFNQLMEFPKTIIFYGSWNNKEYIDGVISLDMFKQIANKHYLN